MAPLFIGIKIDEKIFIGPETQSGEPSFSANYNFDNKIFQVL